MEYFYCCSICIHILLCLFMSVEVVEIWSTNSIVVIVVAQVCTKSIEWRENFLYIVQSDITMPQPITEQRSQRAIVSLRRWGHERFVPTPFRTDTFFTKLQSATQNVLWEFWRAWVTVTLKTLHFRYFVPSALGVRTNILWSMTRPLWKGLLLVCRTTAKFQTL